MQKARGPADVGVVYWVCRAAGIRIRAFREFSPKLQAVRFLSEIPVGASPGVGAALCRAGQSPRA